MKITLKDGSVKEYASPMSAADIAKDISMGLYRNACVCRINGEVKDLRTVISDDAALEILTFDNEEGKRAFNHTASHIMAQAVKRLYPNVKLTIGPAIEDGFYYDFDTETPFAPDDLEKIESEMKKIVKEGLALEKFELAPEDAIKMMQEKDEPYKVELIKEHAGKGEKISFYKQGEFTELCAGPHLMDVKPVKAFKLTNCTGAYWRGDAKNKMLCRVYGTAFPKELGLFTIMEEGPGFPFFLPKGVVLKNTLVDYWREIHRKAGYYEIQTPMILNRALWERSGHWDHYKENMYTTVIDDEDYAIKPMNCPGGMLVYKTQMHSYKDLPLRMGELGLVHRHELSGALHGLMRVRCFTQDDAHIFMTREQIKDEIKNVVRLIDGVYNTFGFEYHIELSTRPENSMGAQEDWDIATDALRDAITELGYDFEVNEGDGAFYGPKLDFHLKDCLGRTWQCGTIQLDFQLPERFELEYVGADGAKHRPIMIHRVVFGSIERFIGILTEHFAGAFPTWLAPVQVKLLPIADRHCDYLKAVENKLEERGIRCEIDDRSEKIGFKIRSAQMEKIPYMLVAGDKDIENGTVSVRSRKDGEQGAMSVEEFAEMIEKEIKTKSL